MPVRWSARKVMRESVFFVSVTGLALIALALMMAFSRANDECREYEEYMRLAKKKKMPPRVKDDQKRIFQKHRSRKKNKKK